MLYFDKSQYELRSFSALAFHTRLDGCFAISTRTFDTGVLDILDLDPVMLLGFERVARYTKSRVPIASGNPIGRLLRSETSRHSYVSGFRPNPPNRPIFPSDLTSTNAINFSLT